MVAAYVALTLGLLAIGWLVADSSWLSGVRAWDDRTSQWFASHRTAFLNDWVQRAGRVADTVPVIVVAAIVEFVIVWTRRWAQLLLLAVGLCFELFVFLTVNYIVARPRPAVAKLGVEPGTYSYPSGHIAATVVLWGGIALLLTWHHPRCPWVAWVAAAAAALIAAVVGFSRIYRGMHHVTDVVAGAVLGVAALAVAVATVRLAERRQPEVVP